MEAGKFREDHPGYSLMKRFPWFETILLIVVMSISLYATFSDAQNLSWHWFIRDDAYYYFKVAQNISEGQGSTFDGINPTNGYHPLWMLICVPIFAFARLDLILPLRILLVVMSGLSVGTAILLYRLLGKIFSPPIGAIAALYWVFSFDVLNIVYRPGLETGIAAFFIVLLVHKLYDFERSWRTNEVSPKQIVSLAVLAIFAMFSRLDLVFLAVMVGLWIVFRGHLLRFYLPLDIASIIVATLLAFVIRNDLPAYYQYVDFALTMVILGLIVKIPSAFLFGLYQRATIFNPVELLKQLFLFSLASSVIIGVIVLACLELEILKGSFSRLILVIDLAFTVLFFGISRLMYLGLYTNRPGESHPKVKPLAYLREHERQWVTEGTLYYGIVLGALGIYMIWSKLEFGTLSPVSGQIKQWWASLPGRAYGGATRNPLSFFGINYTGEANAWNPVSRILGNWSESLYGLRVEDEWRYLIVLTLLAVIFYLILLTNRHRGKTAIAKMAIIPLLSSAWLQTQYYHAIGYAAYKEWYWVSQLIIIVLTLSLLLGLLYKSLHRFPYRHILAWMLAVYAGLNMGRIYSTSIYNSMPYGYWRPDAPYMDIPPLLEEHTEPGSIIGMTGGGNVGYFIHDRTIINMDGLINSYAYFQALQARQAGAYLEQIGVDYVLANPTILDQQPYKGQFNEYMEPMDISYGGKKLMRYGAP
jgi:hypothetical protein